MLRDELTQKSMKVKMVFGLDTPEQILDFEKLNRQIRYRPYLDRFFSKRDLNS
jgi:hypothetical protein